METETLGAHDSAQWSRISLSNEIVERETEKERETEREEQVGFMMTQESMRWNTVWFLKIK